MAVMSNQALIRILTELITTANYLDGVTVHLFKDDFFPTGTTLNADIAAHEADYTGYAPSAAVAWLLPYIDPTGDGVIPGETVQFQPSGTATANTIWGWWLQKGTAGTAVMLAASRLQTPVQLVSPTNALLVDPVFKLRQGVA